MGMARPIQPELGFHSAGEYVNRYLCISNELLPVMNFRSGPRSRLSITAVSTMLMAICSAKLAVAQQTPGESLGNSATLEQQGRQLENLPYTVKLGDFKLLVAPSLGFGWNDNINLAHDH